MITEIQTPYLRYTHTELGGVNLVFSRKTLPLTGDSATLELTACKCLTSSVRYKSEKMLTKTQI